MRVDRQDCSRNHAGGSFWNLPERRTVDAAVVCGPSKEAIREYMARRRNEETPPPSQGEIQRQLGWKFERTEAPAGSRKQRSRRAADSAATAGATGSAGTSGYTDGVEPDGNEPVSTASKSCEKNAAEPNPAELNTGAKPRQSSDQGGFVLNSMSILPGRHPVLEETVEGLVDSCARLVGWMRKRMTAVSRRWKIHASLRSRH